MQIAWLKVELCRLLEEKRSAILRYLKWYWFFGKIYFFKWKYESMEENNERYRRSRNMVEIGTKIQSNCRNRLLLMVKYISNINRVTHYRECRIYT